MDGLGGLARPAAVAEVTFSRPPQRWTASWLGRVAVAAAREPWPTTAGEPMHALAQIDVAELPFAPEAFDGVALVTLFVGPDELPIDTENSVGWCLRTYPTLDRLVPLAEPERSINPKAPRDSAPTGPADAVALAACDRLAQRLSTCLTTSPSAGMTARNA